MRHILILGLWNLFPELRTSEFLVLRLGGLRDYANINKDVKELHFHFIDPPGMFDHMDTGYERFWKIVMRLDNILELDRNELKHRLAP